MPTHLHLSRSTPDHVFDAICGTVMGIRITRETRRKAEDLRQAKVAAAMPERTRHCAPLRVLARRGYKDISTTLPQEYPSVLAYLEAYIAQHHPDVAAFERFRKKGLGEFKAQDFAVREGLNMTDVAGCTQSSSQVRPILLAHAGAIPDLPPELTCKVQGLYWQ